MSILILGMHRSGTSAITRLIASMGAHVAPEHLLLPASHDNPKGFFERTDVLALNRAILASQNCNWYQVSGFDSTRPLPPELEKPMRACVQQLENHAPFVVKDPRFCLTLPYWLPFFSTPPTLVLAVRHPAAIAHSLQRRNDMPPEHGLALWEQYITHALHHLRGLNVVRCDFDSLLSDPENTARSLHAALAHTTLTPPHPLEIDPSLAHAAPGDIALSPAQQQLYHEAIR